MKIAIEGMDGVGKTTIVNRLNKDYGLKIIEKPISKIFALDTMNETFVNKFYENIYSIENDILKSWIIGLGNLYSFICNRDEDIVLDRHFASNYFWNGSNISDPVFNTMINLIGTPDITIILYASVETRLNRIRKRNPKDRDLYDAEKHVIGYDKMIDFLDRFNIPYVVINTDNKSEDEVYEEVKQIVDKVKQNTKSKDLIKKC